MWVYKYIKEKRSDSALHFTLIDPDKQSPEKSAKIAKKSVDAGTDAIMIGGSQTTALLQLDETIKNIKKSVDVPVILFPSSHAHISKYADAIFFMSMLNSRSIVYVIEEQMKGAVIVKHYNLEPLSMGYLLINTNNYTTVSFVADAKPIPRNNPELATAYALAAKYFGMKFVYLEAGSGATHSVPSNMVKLVKKNVNDMFVIVGGGIRNAKTAKEKILAGADIIVTGTIVEKNISKLKQIIKATKTKF